MPPGKGAAVVIVGATGARGNKADVVFGNDTKPVVGGAAVEDEDLCKGGGSCWLFCCCCCMAYCNFEILAVKVL